jgi:hypothetical protein
MSCDEYRAFGMWAGLRMAVVLLPAELGNSSMTVSGGSGAFFDTEM